MTKYENIKTINFIGGQKITVPSGMTVEAVLTALSKDIDNYETRINGDELVLCAPSGTKGALDVQLVDGKVLPLSPCSFLTDSDIVLLSELFPDHNLFDTLADARNLQMYYDAIVAHKQALHERLSESMKSGHLEVISELATTLTACVSLITDSSLTSEQRDMLNTLFDKAGALLDMAIIVETNLLPQAPEQEA